MKHGSLFSGIGGFDLGFERAGIETAWQVEISDYCRRVLERHFPSATRYADIRECGARNLSPIDIISGGFPCQDISNAGKRAGIDGERSGLWSEYARIIRELRPRYVVVENVAALLGRGMGRVLGDLAACGYGAEWRVLPACHFGLPHLRERVWIVAYDERERLEGARIPRIFPPEVTGRHVSVPRLSPSDTVRKRNGIPDYVDRIRACGNAIVPPLAEYIGRRIVAVERGPN